MNQILIIPSQKKSNENKSQITKNEKKGETFTVEVERKNKSEAMMQNKNILEL